MTQSIFIAGTDTDVGKTFVAGALLKVFNKRSMTTAGYKPISAGCRVMPEGLRNEDALVLQQASSLDLDYNEVNPIAFEDPVAPHLAARRNNTEITTADVEAGYRVLAAKQPDVLLVEGAGGWRLPLDNQGGYLSDFVRQQNLPVVLVVGMKLGCLNHAMLTIEAIENDGLKLAGWIANQIDPDMLYQEENFAALKELIEAPCLGKVPQLKDPAAAHEYLDISALL